MFPIQVEGEREQNEGKKKWTKIKANIKLNVNFDLEQTKALWLLSEEFQDMFIWHKGELNNCSIDEHTIDTQGLPPYRMSLGRLSHWKKAKVNGQI